METPITSFNAHKIHVRDYNIDRPLTQYMQTTSQRRKEIHGKYNTINSVNRILSRWISRKYEHDARRLQNDSNQNDYNPIWKYRKSIRQKTKHVQHYAPHNEDGSVANTVEERQAIDRMSSSLLLNNTWGK